jgi:hypothetical protein
MPLAAPVMTATLSLNSFVISPLFVAYGILWKRSGRGLPDLLGHSHTSEVKFIFTFLVFDVPKQVFLDLVTAWV